MNPRLEFFLTAEEQSEMREKAQLMALQLGALATRALKNYAPRYPVAKHPVAPIPAEAARLILTADAIVVGHVRRLIGGQNEPEHLRAAILQELKRLPTDALIQAVASKGAG